MLTLRRGEDLGKGEVAEFKFSRGGEFQRPGIPSAGGWAVDHRVQNTGQTETINVGGIKKIHTIITARAEVRVSLEARKEHVLRRR